MRRTKQDGIDLLQLSETVEEIARDPARGRIGFGVTTAWRGRARTESRVDDLTVGGKRIERGFRFATDEPLALFGNNESANPQEYLLGAINACMIVGYVTGAAIRGITLDKLEIESRGELDLRGFLGIDPDVNPGYDTIRATVHLSGNGTEEQYRAIHETVQKTSPNYLTVSHPVRLESQLVVE